VVITADDTAGVGALLRWDPAGYAERELALRQELQLPPAVRIASVTGGRTAVGHFTQAVERQLGGQGIVLRAAGPAPLVLTAGAGAAAGPQPGASKAAARAAEDVRTLLFIPYAQAGEATRAMRAVKAAAAAKRSDYPVQLRLDGVDVL
jgi:primosomal protein N' (replication factor Y)